MNVMDNPLGGKNKQDHFLMISWLYDEIDIKLKEQTVDGCLQRNFDTI